MKKIFTLFLSIAFLPLGLAASTPVWEGDSGGVHVAILPDDVLVSVPGKEEFSFKKFYQAEIDASLADVQENAAEQLKSSGDREYSYTISMKPLSLVNGVLSIHFETGGDTGGAHPFAASYFRAIDLPDMMKASSPNPVSHLAKLTGTFSERDLLTALAADKFLQKQLGTKSFKSLDTFLKSQPKDSCSFSISKNSVSDFAYHSMQGTKVAVRIAFTHGCEVERGKLTQVGLLLPASDELTQQLKTGFTMETAKKNFKNAGISVSWTKSLSELAKTK